MSGTSGDERADDTRGYVQVPGKRRGPAQHRPSTLNQRVHGSSPEAQPSLDGVEHVVVRTHQREQAHELVRRELERCRGQSEDPVEVEGWLVIVPEIAIGREQQHRSVAVRVVMRLVHDHDVPARSQDLPQEGGRLALLLSLRGNVVNLQRRVSAKGNAYFTFDLSDGAGLVRVFSFGQTPCKPGDEAAVDGQFDQVKRGGRYTFRNEVTGTRVVCR